MKKVAIFVRVSEHSNANEMLKRQCEDVSNYCKTKGYSVCDTISLIGDRKTGNFLLKTMLDTAKSNGIETVIMKSTNRIVGTREELSETEIAFEKSGVSLETMDMGVII